MACPKNIKTAEENEISADAVVKYLRDCDASRLNALKHGLTAKLDPASVLQWYRIILGDPSTELLLLIGPDLTQRAALALARAEVHLRRTLTTCDDFIRGACQIIMPGVAKNIRQTQRATNRCARLLEHYRREALSKQRAG